MRLLLEALAELLFPACCLGCGEQLGSSRPPLLCANCRAGIAVISPPCCSGCGAPDTDGLCTACRRHAFAFDRARSFFIYQEPLRSLIHQFKFDGSLASLSSFAALAHEAAALFDEPDLILPVPLHLRRLRWRGFNQSLLLAKACFPAWKQKIEPDLLQRHRATVPQTQLDGAERRSNLAGAFSLREPQTVRGRRVLLTDDVFTTGATVNECAKVLKQAGCRKVEVVTLCRAAGAQAFQKRGNQCST